MITARREITEAGLEMIRGFEALRLESYRCPAGRWTIGYGHTGPEVGPGQKFTQPRAEAQLRADVRLRVEVVERCLIQAATDNQFAAMVSLAFNIGGDRVIVRKVNHPGTRPKPFLRPALEQSRAAIARLLEQAKAQIARRWERG